jgi:hypothetical protein
MTIASRIVTRRALLGAGALALLAGCGPPEEPKIDAGRVLGEQLRVTQAVADAYAGVPGEGRANAEARVRRLEAAMKQAGGNVVTITGADSGLEQALAAESEALRAHVAAVGQLEAPQWRELLAGLITDAAAGESALLARLNRPSAPTAFPGEPVP